MPDQMPLIIGDGPPTIVNGVVIGGPPVPSPTRIGGPPRPARAGGQSPGDDVGVLLETLAAHAATGVTVGALRAAVPDPGRYESAFRALRDLHYLAQFANGNWCLSAAGQLALQEHRRPKARPEHVDHSPQSIDLDGLRRAYVESLPARHRVLEERARAEEQARAEALRREESEALGHLGNSLWAGWKIGLDPHPTPDNALALFPAVEGVADCPYLRLRVDPDQPMLWMQASTGGPVEFVRSGWPPEQIRWVLVWLLVDALEGRSGD